MASAQENDVTAEQAGSAIAQEETEQTLQEKLFQFF